MLADHTAITVKQLAERYAVKQHVILKLIKDGELKALDLTTSQKRRWRILAESVEAFELRRAAKKSERMSPRRKKQDVGMIDPETGRVRREYRTVGSIRGPNPGREKK